MSRRLSPETAGRMLAVARQLCPQIKRIPVTAANGDQEAQAFASDFVKVFKDAVAIPICSCQSPALPPTFRVSELGLELSQTSQPRWD